MAVRLGGNYAQYRFRPECTWVTGNNAGVLRSDGYGSCVGLVLYSGAPRRIGVVAHFSGSMQAPQVRADALEIMAAVCPIAPGRNWRGWVFGGVSLNGSSSFQTLSSNGSSFHRTKTLIDQVRAVLNFNRMFDVNYNIPGPEKYTLSTQGVLREMYLQPGNNYIGHQGVNLNLANGRVTWDDGDHSTKNSNSKKLINSMI
ncbi:hypothetical protein BTJ40_14760 [Microbulbifer sp. A4B17]|uniref:hypothetical protein n=1 Tax=Microbulbifer sp. A4B17 TaxID=359370 RepID=UPI000D52CD73|nr:hypothetical protein [Microbulbifer sp. A4B17]AWF81985.1 hypothetical protein BTJ40_14760 [Microbulbifer sp. A4B17]